MAKLDLAGYKALLALLNDQKVPVPLEFWDLGYVNEQGLLNEKGRKVAQQIQAQVEELRRGKPLSEWEPRKRYRAVESGIWRIIKRKMQYNMSEDGSCLFFGKPIGIKDTTTATREEWNHIRGIRKLVKFTHKWKEVFPYAFFKEDLDSPILIVFQTKVQDFTACMDSKYFDYFKLRFPSVQWLVSPAIPNTFFVGAIRPGGRVIVQMQTGQNAVAVVMPFETYRGWRPPAVKA